MGFDPADGGTGFGGSADGVYRIVPKRIPKVSLGTIYRNLEILSENGRIQKLEGVETQRRHDGTTENHYHLRFVSCGRVIDLIYKPLKETEKAVFKLGEYEIFSYKLELIGRCLPCKSEKQKINNKSFRNCGKEKAK